jgi:hypothetical protein
VAIYVPRARRRRNLIMIGVAGLVVGLALGSAAGRSSAPTVEDRVRSVRSEVRAITSQLRVVSIHEGEGAASLAAGGDAGADLALQRTETNLRRLFTRAPWVPSQAGAELLADTVALRAAAPRQASTEEFGQKVDDLASRIEETFGATP